MLSEASLLLFSCFTILSLWLLSSCPGNDSCTSSHCVYILKRKNKEQIEHRESASQVCPQTESHGHFFLPGETWEVSFGAERITITSKNEPLLVRKKESIIGGQTTTGAATLCKGKQPQGNSVEALIL